MVRYIRNILQKNQNFQYIKGICESPGLNLCLPSGFIGRCRLRWRIACASLAVHLAGITLSHWTAAPHDCTSATTTMCNAETITTVFLHAAYSLAPLNASVNVA